MNACATASSLHSLSPAVAPQEPYLLEVLNVSKGFPGVVALANVQLRVRPGTVLALMGENGACLLYTSPSPRDRQKSRMPSSA